MAAKVTVSSGAATLALLAEPTASVREVGWAWLVWNEGLAA